MLSWHAFNKHYFIQLLHQIYERRDEITNSSWFAGDLPILALNIPCLQNPLSPRQTRMVGQLWEKIHIDSPSEPGVWLCTLFIFFPEMEIFKVQFLILSPPFVSYFWKKISFVDWITKLHEERLKTSSE